MLKRFGGVYLGLAFLTSAAGQLAAADFPLRGQLLPAEAACSGMVVELAEGAGETALRAVADNAGQFHFDAVRPGTYELRVFNQPGAMVYRAPVSIQADAADLSVELPRPAASKPAPGTVSLAALRHTPPSKAVREFRNAERYIERREFDRAIAALEKAIAIDPLYTDAYVNLAACYGSRKDYVRAESYARRAVDLDPGSAPAQANFAHMLLYLKRNAEAEAAARQALKLEASDSSHFLLALALKQQGRNQEALPHLRRAAVSMPMAHLHAAEVLARMGQRPDAAAEIRAYLASGQVEDRRALASWLAKLEHP